MPSAQIQDLKEDIQSIRGDIGELRSLTQNGFERMNGRVKKLEIKEAERRGAASVSGNRASPKDWLKLATIVATALGTAILLAYTVVQGMLK